MFIRVLNLLVHRCIFVKGEKIWIRDGWRFAFLGEF